MEFAPSLHTPKGLSTGSRPMASSAPSASPSPMTLWPFARMLGYLNGILPCQEAFLVDAPTPEASPHRWIQA